MRLSYCFSALFLIFLINSSCEKSRKQKMYICDQQYALCTSAHCIPSPEHPTESICFCDVEEGKSLGNASCAALKPHTDKNGVRTIFSTYSFKQYQEGLKAMTCPPSALWSWCLGKRCTQDAKNPKKALCLCDIKSSKKEWVTLGGDCDTTTCENAFWSGATLEDNKTGSEFLAKDLDLKSSPIKWCKAPQ